MYFSGFDSQHTKKNSPNLAWIALVQNLDIIYQTQPLPNMGEKNPGMHPRSPGRLSSLFCAVSIFCMLGFHAAGSVECVRLLSLCLGHSVSLSFLASGHQLSAFPPLLGLQGLHTWSPFINQSETCVHLPAKWWPLCKVIPKRQEGDSLSSGTQVCPELDVLCVMYWLINFVFNQLSFVLTWSKINFLRGEKTFLLFVL